MSEVRVGDCVEVMRGMGDNSVDACVTDPPYGLSFMGKHWDHGVPGVQFWAEILRTMKAGAYLLAFGGTRTYHRMACAIEDAGFEIHDCLSWLYGSGFPKHKSKLKPAWEPIVMARKPAPRATLLNINACRIDGPSTVRDNRARSSYHSGSIGAIQEMGEPYTTGHPSGRWPANVVLDEEAAQVLDEQSGELTSGANPARRGSDRSRGVYDAFAGQRECTPARGVDVGGASRFFFVAKPTSNDVRLTLCGICEKHYIKSANPTEALCGSATNAEPTSNHAEPAPSPARGDVPRSEPLGVAANADRSNGNATSAGSRSPITTATAADSVRSDAPDSLTERIARDAMSAGDLCDSCGIAIARALAALRNRRDPASALGPVSTSERKRQTLLRSLALCAETWASTDTTPTIASLTMWFGYARDAIANITNWESADQKSASGPPRFRYEAKASRAEREAGLDGMPMRSGGSLATGKSSIPIKDGRDLHRTNHHPTVKPVALMRWLVRLVTPPDGLVLDPFAGSGTTGIAATLEGRRFVGIERDAEYAEIARARIQHHTPKQTALEIPA